MNQDLSRRAFLETTAKAGAAASLPFIVPRRALGGAAYQAPTPPTPMAATFTVSLGAW